MTKTELCRIAGNAYLENSARRLNYCSAWYYTDRRTHAVALRSYSTIVAVYWRGIVYEFGRWSNTTTQHVRKFARLMDAPIISLYRHSRMRLSDFWLHENCDWKDVIDAVAYT